MGAFTYVHIIDFSKKTTTHKHFTKIQDAVSYVKRYPCKGHFVFARRYDEVLCIKCDTEMKFGYHFFERISKGCTCDSEDVRKTDTNSEPKLWACSCRP